MNNNYKHKELMDKLITASTMYSKLPVVKEPTNIVRKEYPYFKRVIRSILGKPTYYEVNEWVSPVFNEAKGDEIKVKVMEFK